MWDGKPNPNYREHKTTDMSPPFHPGKGDLDLVRDVGGRTSPCRPVIRRKSGKDHVFQHAVHKDSGGKVTVTDGPFAEAKEVIGGYALLSAASKEEAVEYTRRLLEHVYQGAWEVYQLFGMPTGDGQ